MKFTSCVTQALVGCIPIAAEIIKFGQSSHKMYSNNIVNFHVCTTNLNACSKIVWKLIVWFQLLALVREHIWRKILLMGYLMRLKLTHFQFKWTLVSRVGLYSGHSTSFLECVYFGLLYPFLIFDMFIVVYVWVWFCLVWFGFFA